MNERKLRLNHRYVLRHTTKTVRAIINEIDYRLNINTLERESPVSELQTNDIGQVRIKTLAARRLRSLQRESSDRRLHPGR